MTFLKIFIYEHLFIKIEVQISGLAKVNHLTSRELHERQ